MIFVIPQNFLKIPPLEISVGDFSTCLHLRFP